MTVPLAYPRVLPSPTPTLANPRSHARDPACTLSRLRAWGCCRESDDEDDVRNWVDAPGGAGGKVRRGSADDKGTGKVRFVWSSELHERFEQAVAKLGVDRAKPQAISQLMGIEGDNAPTRQNIKSHLQKYRLFVKKRAAQAAGELPPSTSKGGGGGSGHGPAAAAAAAAERAAAAASAAPPSEPRPAAVQ